MPVYKDDKTSTWYVKRRYKDWTGKVKNLTKRGFALKREAVEWEKEFLLRQAGTLNMTLASFYRIYKQDMGGKLKEKTWESKIPIIETHILPHLGELHMQEITSVEVMRWHNTLMEHRSSSGKPLAQTYLKVIHNQLSAIFNHAVKHYRLPENPVRLAGSIGEKDGGEMQIWTQEEYRRFSEAIKDKPLSFYCFELLYWCGIREGELLALTLGDLDFKKKEVTINKTFHRAKGEDIITTPKTKQSVRKVSMPDFLCEEIQTYISTLYKPQADERIFPVSKDYLLREIKRGCKLSGVKCIRVHDIRHSHVSLLIHMGYSAVAIAKRVGHRSVDITYRYAHLFPSVQADMMDKLNKLQEGNHD